MLLPSLFLYSEHKINKLDINIRYYPSLINFKSFAVKIVEPIPNSAIEIHNPVEGKLIRSSNLSHLICECLVVDHFSFWHQDRCPRVKEIETDRCL